MITLTKEEATQMIQDLQKLPFESVANPILMLNGKLRELEDKDKSGPPMKLKK